MPEWLKGADCKSAGIAYVGSNPTPSTSKPERRYATPVCNLYSVTKGQKTIPSGEQRLFAFLTCEPNATVASVHPKAMPVILTATEECKIWLSAPADEALRLQRPLPDGLRQLVARGEKQDPPSETPETALALLL